MIKLEYGCALSGVDLKGLYPRLKEAIHWLREQVDGGVVGFPTLVDAPVGPVLSLAEKKREIADTLVVVGIGGSSLGAECAAYALEKSDRFFVLDNVDPHKVLSVLNTVDLKRTCFNVVSKSGGTTETLVNFEVVLSHLKRSMSWREAKSRIVITTDPQRGLLREFAESEGIDTLPVPENVGGRFSVLSPVGLFPLAFLGVDVKGLLGGAASALGACWLEGPEDNPALTIAALHYLHYRSGKNIAVMMPYAERLSLFVSWWRQLWAESLGKNDLGQTPVKAIGTVDQHSQIQLYNDGPRDKLITFVVVEDMGEDVTISEHMGFEELAHLEGKTLSEVLKASYLGTTSALAKKGIPFMTLWMDRLDEPHLGALFVIYEMATAFAGYLYGVNPFDQPGVEEGKRLTHGVLGRRGYEQKGEEAKRLASSCSKYLVSVEL